MPTIRKQLLLLLFMIVISVSPAFVQAQDTEIVKSDVIEQIDGREYYLHIVEQGQTLYSISKVYDVPVDELIFENPDAAQGLAIDQVLRIPLTSREKKITEDLRKGEFRYIFHIVKKGQTMYGIARIYNVDLNDLKAANPEWEAGLKTGQYIKIPMRETLMPEREEPEVSSQAAGKIHVVGAGETLFSISRKYNVEIADLKAINPGLSRNLSPGQKIRIPKEKVSFTQEVKPAFYEHIVKQGETLYRIAKKYRTSIDSLKSFNSDLSENIYPGEVIRIPTTINKDNYITHRVREKTKLKKIASKYALSVTAMKDANPGIKSRVYPGDLLHIPVGPPPDEPRGELIVIEEKPDDIPPRLIKSDSVRCYEDVYKYTGELKVALMIPLYAEEAHEIEIDENPSGLDPGKYKSFNFIQFYEGFLMALEEMKDEGLNVKLYVYDVDEKVSKTIQVLQQPELSSMDIIIGPFFSRNFKLVSNFAEMFDIRIVNPLTRRTEVLNNPMVFKMKPSRNSQPALLTKLVKEYYPESNIILVRNNKYKFSKDIDIIKQSLDNAVPYGVLIPNYQILDLINEYSEADTNLMEGERYPELMVESRTVFTEMLELTPEDSTFFPNGIAEIIYAQDSVHGIIRNASVVRNNLVVVLSDSEIFAPEILTRLNDLKDTFDISVVGLPEWGVFDNLETDYLLDLDVHFFSDAYYDYEDAEVQEFVAGFRDKYKTQPGTYAFEGYDLAGFVLGAMMRFGPDCGKCLQYYEHKALKTNYKLVPAFPAGYENVFWNICRYRNYNVEKIPIDKVNR